MPTYRLRVQLEAPLAVSDSRSASNRSKTPSYVPAPTLRGALAAHLRQHGASDALMAKIFGTSGCRTTRLEPVGGSAPSEATDVQQEVFPAPLTLNTCKRHSGFLGEVTDGESAHGAEDLLFASTVFATTGDAAPLRSSGQCTECQNALVPVGGAVRLDHGAYRRAASPAKRTQVHAGRDRRRKGSAAGVLYAREVIEERSTSPSSSTEESQNPALFEARISGSQDVIDALSSFIQSGERANTREGEERRAGQGTVLNVGAAVSRGLGRCHVVAFGPAPRRRPIEERVQVLNEAWAKRAAATSEMREKGKGPLVTLTLRTPAFFTGEWLRPEMSPSAEDLLQDAGEPEQPYAEALRRLEKVHQVARPFRLRAWNGLAGFPHATDQGLAAGSVLVFRAPAWNGDLEEALAHIEEAGIGLRRELGFGAAVVSDPLHAQMHEHTRPASTAS